jgi:hypothetical protein
MMAYYADTHHSGLPSFHAGTNGSLGSTSLSFLPPFLPFFGIKSKGSATSQTEISVGDKALLFINTLVFRFFIFGHELYKPVLFSTRTSALESPRTIG